MSASPSSLPERFAAVRARTLSLSEPLAPEDTVLQTMEVVSPTKWHLAHTTWFWERFLLRSESPGYRPIEDAYDYLFNSYYQSVGPMHTRARRGEISRPTLEEVLEYRRHVDAAMETLLRDADPEELNRWGERVRIGLNHEEQHQELLLTDIKHVLSVNPLMPAYRENAVPSESVEPAPGSWVEFEGGLVEIGHEGEGFAWDNERPRHKVWLEPFQLHRRTVTCGEYLAFIEDDGYERSELWLADGWNWLAQTGVRSPLYWARKESGWTVFTLGGLRDLVPEEPVCHLSYYEADAYARWAGARLPREEEWEHAARLTGTPVPQTVGFLEEGSLHPRPLQGSEGDGLVGLMGGVWEWTASPYTAYPGYRSYEGNLGEYNGKFMCNQWVLRGGSCATPRDHIRTTYRNFFYPKDRWQFMGLRLARS